jgi:hypothetical protein
MSTQIYEKFKKEEDEDEYIEYNSVTGKWEERATENTTQIIREVNASLQTLKMFSKQQEVTRQSPRL